MTMSYVLNKFDRLIWQKWKIKSLKMNICTVNKYIQTFKRREIVK